MTTNQLENNWQLPGDFLDSKIYLSHVMPTYEIPDNFIKFFDFQSPVPAETPEETNEKNKAIQEQVKLGIIKLNYLPQQTDTTKTTFHPQLKVSSTNPKITILNGQPVLYRQPKSQPDFIDMFLNKTNYKVSNNTLFKTDNKKVGKNDKCPCGSGKKYKVCHGR